jgi:hypothetical protein
MPSISEYTVTFIPDTSKLDAALDEAERRISGLTEKANQLRGISSEMTVSVDSIISGLEAMQSQE